MLLPQQSHEAVVLLAAARGVRRAAGASQRVVILADGGVGDLSGWKCDKRENTMGFFFGKKKFKIHRAQNQQTHVINIIWISVVM